jgi:hypothetical protein
LESTNPKSRASFGRTAKRAPRFLALSLRESDRPDIVRRGDERAPVSALDHSLVRMSWMRFVGLFLLAFLVFNFFFTGLFFLDEGGLSAAAPNGIPNFVNAFFFSVHTVAPSATEMSIPSIGVAPKEHSDRRGVRGEKIEAAEPPLGVS